MNKQLFDVLSKLGLEKEQIDLYTFLLNNGPTSVLEASRHININRTKIYRIIEKLQQIRLIEETRSSRGTLIAASDISAIQNLIDEQNIKANTLKQEFLLFQKSFKPLSTETYGFTVKDYKGKEGIKQMLWNELKAKEIFVFDFGNLDDIIGKKFADKFRIEVMLRGNKYFLLTNTKYETLNEISGALDLNKIYEYRYISPEILNIIHTTTIFHETIGIIDYDRMDYGFEIINKTYAQMQKEVFWHYWELGQPVN